MGGAGYAVQVIAAYRGEALPSEHRATDIVVVMGGPMGVAEIGQDGFGWLGEVVELLRGRQAKDWPCIGICLGAQLMAHAAGAKVAPMVDAAGQRVREVGWGELEIRKEEGLMAGLPEKMEVLHWHGDACELPAGAVLLASTVSCPVQMFRLGKSVGLQFHPEIDGATACIWAAADAEFVRAAKGSEGVRDLQVTSLLAAARTEESRRRMLAQVIRYVSGNAG